MLRQLLSAPKLQDANELELLARCWLALAMGILHLYVPATPADPAVMQRCAANVRAAEKDMVSQQLSRDNGSIRHLRQLLSGVEDITQANIRPQSADRGDVPRLHSFWTEIGLFMSQVLAPTKLHALLADLEARAIHAGNREVVIQESLSAFNQRLDTVYPDFSGISGPIQLALLYAKLGFHFVANGAGYANGSEEKRLRSARAILAFPALKSADMLRRVEIPHSSSTSAAVPALVQMAGIALEAAVTSNVQAIQDQTEAIFEQIFGLWSLEQSRSAQAEREAQSLYRHQDDAITEAELEEQDFLTAFPQFEDILEDAPVTVHSTSTPTTGKRSVLFDPAHVATLGKLYQVLYSDRDTMSTKVSKTFAALRLSAIKTLLGESQGATPGTLD